MAEAYSAEKVVVTAARALIQAKLTAAGAPYTTIPIIAAPADRSITDFPYITCYEGNEEQDWRAQRTEGSIVIFQFEVYTKDADLTRDVSSLVRRALGIRPQFWGLPTGYKMITLRPLDARQAVYTDNLERVYSNTIRYRTSVYITKT